MSGLCTNKDREFDESLDGAPDGEQDDVALQYCPHCGYDLHATQPNGEEALICCAECGSEWKLDELLALPPPGPIGQVALAVAAWAGRSLKVTIIVTLFVVVAGGLLMPAIGTCRCGAGVTRARMQLWSIAKAMSAYAAEHNDRYPPHAAHLVIGGYVGSDIFTDPKKSRPVSFVGAFQLESFDGSTRSETALRNAVEMTDLDAPHYRVGDYWVVRFVRPMNDGNLVSGWSYLDSKGRRSVLFEDGRTEMATSAEWSQIWQGDAAARQALNLPAFATPTW